MTSILMLDHKKPDRYPDDLPRELTEKIYDWYREYVKKKLAPPFIHELFRMAEDWYMEEYAKEVDNMSEEEKEQALFGYNVDDICMLPTEFVREDMMTDLNYFEKLTDAYVIMGLTFLLDEGVEGLVPIEDFGVPYDGPDAEHRGENIRVLGPQIPVFRVMSFNGEAFPNQNPNEMTEYIEMRRRGIE